MATRGPEERIWDDVLKDPLYSQYFSFDAEFNRSGEFSFVTQSIHEPLNVPLFTVPDKDPAMFADVSSNNLESTSTGVLGTTSDQDAGFESPSSDREVTSTGSSSKSSAHAACIEHSSSAQEVTSTDSPSNISAQAASLALPSSLESKEDSLSSQSSSWGSSEKGESDLEQKCEKIEAQMKQAKENSRLNKHEKRVIRNRLSAKLFRLKKKVEQQGLLSEVEEHIKQIAQLEAENTQLKEKVAQLEAEKLAEKLKVAPPQDSFEFDFKSPAASLHLQYSPSKESNERKRRSDSLCVSVASSSSVVNTSQVKPIRSRRMNAGSEK